MDYNLIFDFLSFSPGIFWLLLIFTPKNKTAMKLFDIFLLLLSLIYSIMIIPDIPSLLPIIAKPEFETLRNILSTPKGFLASWNHFILSDLWIGRWITLNAIECKFPTSFRIIILFISLFFGPLGLCVYLISRLLLKKKLYITEI